MRLFVVEINDGGAEAAYATREELETRMQREWEGVPTVRALDQAALAALDISHVGQVVTWRMGWIFCAEDDKS
jgi:hypothetical protein